MFALHMNIDVVELIFCLDWVILDESCQRKKISSHFLLGSCWKTFLSSQWSRTLLPIAPHSRKKRCKVYNSCNYRTVVYFHPSSHLPFFLIDYRIVIICSSKKEETSYFISKLRLFKQPYVPHIDSEDFKKYLTIHFSKKTGKQSNAETLASTVDSSK